MSDMKMKTVEKSKNSNVRKNRGFRLRRRRNWLYVQAVMLFLGLCANAAVVPNDDVQTLNLSAGWNWIGLTILPTSHKVGDVLGTAGFTANDVVQSATGVTRFNGTSWIPSNFTLEYGKLYQIYVSRAATVTVAGAAGGVASVPVAAGWNWVANPKTTAVAPSRLAHSGGWTAGDRIQSTNGTVTYTGSQWVPSAGFTLAPGKGYQIYSAKAGTISF